MSDPSAAEAVELDPAQQARLLADTEDFKEKMKYVGLQIHMLPPEEKAKFGGEFKDVSKSLNKLRRVLAQKEQAQLEWYEFNWQMWGCVLAMLLIFG